VQLPSASELHEVGNVRCHEDAILVEREVEHFVIVRPDATSVADVARVDAVLPA
jgi:hypothetical protein